MIKRDMPSKRSAINEYQAQFLAQSIRRLEKATDRNFRACSGELTIEEYARFRDMPEVEDFMQAALICGFVCSDFGTTLSLEKVHSRPQEMVPTFSFLKLRHYIHILQRTTKWNSQYSTALFMAVQSGALGYVARRLESDESLREPLFDENESVENEA
jgi:hypothetical protein